MNKRDVIQEVYETCNSYNYYNVAVVWKEGRKWCIEHGYKVNDCTDSFRHRTDPEFEDFMDYKIFHRTDNTTKNDIIEELSYFS